MTSTARPRITTYDWPTARVALTTSRHIGVGAPQFAMLPTVHPGYLYGQLLAVNVPVRGILNCLNALQCCRAGSVKVQLELASPNQAGRRGDHTP